MELPNLFSNIKVIGFDLDQTLYPKSPDVDEKIQSYLYQKIAEHKGVSIEEGERLFKERYREGSGLTGRQTLEDLGLPRAGDLVQEALEHAEIASALLPDPEINRLLTALKPRFAVDLITGSNLEQTQKKLRAIDIEPQFFAHVITADDASKSTGEAYALWLSRYPNLQPKQFLYVGDRPKSDHDIPSALGIQTALVYALMPDDTLTCPQYPSLKEFLLTLTA